MLNISSYDLMVISLGNSIILLLLIAVFEIEEFIYKKTQSRIKHIVISSSIDHVGSSVNPNEPK
jgi:hypothetical protein